MTTTKTRLHSLLPRGYRSRRSAVIERPDRHGTGQGEKSQLRAIYAQSLPPRAGTHDRAMRRCDHHDTVAISAAPPASTNHCACPSTARATPPRLTAAAADAAPTAPRRAPFEFFAQSACFMSSFCSARIALLRRSQRSKRPTSAISTQSWCTRRSRIFVTWGVAYRRIR